MKILHIDLCSSYPLARAGGHRTMHAMLKWIAKQNDMDCVSVYSRRGMGSQLIEYDPGLSDLFFLGVKSVNIENDRWIFDCGYRAIAENDVEGSFDEYLAEYQPDVVWSTGFNSLPLLQRARQSGCGALWYIQDCRPELHDLQTAGSQNIEIIACSDFIKQRMKKLASVESTTVYPLIDYRDYLVKDNSKKYVTFINPRPVKGYETFLKIAGRSPDVEFLVVEAWPLGENFSAVEQQLGCLPNVTFMPQTTDVRKVFSQTKILLVPSVVEDAAPRVIREAQINGIPVIGSRRGGIAEITGEGGLIIDDYENAASWASVIHTLINDAARMETLSMLALENARREDFSENEIMQHFKQACHRAIKKLKREENEIKNTERKALIE